MVACCTQNIAHNIVETTVRFNLDRIRLLAFPARAATVRILAMPIVPKVSNEICGSVNIVPGCGNSFIAFIEKELISRGMVVLARLLPVWSIVIIEIVH